ncbi:MAG: Sua5/YciO/YrdC/YwlC family protein, partial [Eggerthellaceae bacterium]|nr:Sua5/YciO/YrdC/YwlC family protein [Eggerthellaceae bacterium]
WPGPLTLIVRASERVPARFRAREGTIGLRMPASMITLSIIDDAGAPLAVTSANTSGSPDPASVEDIESAITDKVDAIMGAREPMSGEPSTIVDCTKSSPVIIREGGISADAIAALS